MMSNKAFYFLASPYHGSEAEKIYRYDMSLKVANSFLKLGISIFAPILYNQALIEGFSESECDNRRQLLMPMNLDFIFNAKGGILLKLPGWESSSGMKQYIEICAQENLETFELMVDNIDYQIEILANHFNDDL